MINVTFIEANYIPVQYIGMGKQIKQRKTTTLKEDIGKLLFEIGRVGFGSVVIGSLLRWEIPNDTLFYGGSAAVAACFIASIILGVREIKTDKPPLRRRKRRKR